MSDDIVPFKPKADLTAEQNLRAFIERGRDKLTAFGVGCWSENNWKATFSNRAVSSRFSTNTQTSTSYKYTPLASPYIDFAKAYIRDAFSNRPVSNLQRHLEAVRVLEEALIDTKGNADILLLDGTVLDYLDEVFQRRMSSATGRNKAGYQLETLLNFCRDNEFTPSLPEWSNPYGRQKDLTIAIDKKGKEFKSEKMPTDEEMMLVAELFHRAPSLGAEAEYFTSIMALLMSAPSRGSEPLTLPVDCLEWEKDTSGKNQLGIRWVPVKNGREGLKWVVPIMQDVVVEAVARLKRISEPARKTAKFAEENPNVFMRHEGCITSASHGDEAPLILEQLNAALSTNYDSYTLAAPTPKWLINVLENNAGRVNYKALGECEYTKYIAKFKNWPYVDKARKVKASDALMLCRENEFHMEFNPRGYSFTLPTVNQINDRFVQKETREGRSLWEKHGIQKSNKESIRLNSHKARHWLSTKAERGGMDELTLANWAGRARIADNKKYDHRTAEEKAEEARALLIPEDASILDKIEVNLPVSYEDIGKDLIGVAIVTELGVCEHDFAMTPCQRNGDCETCKEMVCIKGYSDSLELLKKREIEVSEQLNKSMDSHSMGVFGADRWVSALGWRLSHIRTKIQILEDANNPDGTPVRIPDEFDPSPIKSALMDKGMEVEIKRSETIELDGDVYDLLGM